MYDDQMVRHVSLDMAKHVITVQIVVQHKLYQDHTVVMECSMVTNNVTEVSIVELIVPTKVQVDEVEAMIVQTATSLLVTMITPVVNDQNMTLLLLQNQ